MQICIYIQKHMGTVPLWRIQHIYEDDELDEISTCRKFRQVQKEGNRMVHRTKMMYNLDMIISVGYLMLSNSGLHACVLAKDWYTVVFVSQFVRMSEKRKFHIILLGLYIALHANVGRFLFWFFLYILCPIEKFFVSLQYNINNEFARVTKSSPPTRIREAGECING